MIEMIVRFAPDGSRRAKPRYIIADVQRNIKMLRRRNAFFIV